MHTSLKSTFSGLNGQFRRRYYGSIFIRLAVVQLLPSKIAKSREIPTKFDLIAVQGHPRSSSLVSIEIVTLAISATVFEILTLKPRKWLIFPPHPCLGPPLWGTPGNLPRKEGENCMILTSTFSTDPLV